MQPFTIPRLFDFNKKPVDSVVLDYSNPLTNKLRHAFIFQNTHRGSEFTTRYSVFDHSSGLVFGTRNNTIAAFKGRQSNWFNGNGTGIPVSNGTINNGFFAFDSEVSVYTRVFYNTLTQDHTLFDINDQQLVIWADWTTTPDKLGTRIYPGGGGPTGSAGGLDSPPWVSWGGGVKDTGSNTTDCYAYKEGFLDASSLAQGTAGWTSSVNYRFGVNFNGGTKKSNAYYEYIYCWEKLLSAEEFKSINDYPYQIFKPAIPITYFIPAASGSYTLTADSGSYAYTGTATGLKKGSKVQADSGSYALTGSTVNLNKGFKVQADSGSYALTGTSTGLKRGLKLPANSGSYSYSGQTVGLLKGYKLPADAGSYTLTGQNVTLTYSPASSTYTLTCDAGSYTLTGVSQAFLRTYVLDMESGAYTLTGSNVTISYSSGIWEVQSDDNSTWSVQSNN